MNKLWTDEEIRAWPTGHKKCKTCLEVRPFSQFHKNTSGVLGYANKCKECRHKDSARQYANKSIEKRILSRAKYRANKKELEFDLELEDIVVPDVCPVLGIELEYGGVSNDSSPSIDRMDPNKGYVKGNVKVISYRANMIKSNANAEEIAAVLEYVRGCDIESI